MLSIEYTSVDTGASLTNLDPFVSACYAALAEGSTLTNGSNQSLLQFVEDGISVAGLPVLVSDQVDASTLFWGIPKQHVMFVQRTGTTVERFPNMQQDGTWIRAVSRLGLVYLNPAGIVRGFDVTP